MTEQPTITDPLKRKPLKHKGSKVARFNPNDPQEGPCMRALPSDKYRDFVRSMYQVKPGHGAAVRAARLAGFGTPQSSAQTMATIASRLTHDPRVQEAFAEQDKLYIRASAPRAIHALSHLIETPSHKDHARALGMVLDRVHAVESIHNVKMKVEHDASPDLKETAQVMKRIAELVAKFSVRLPAPHVIDGEAIEMNPQAAE